MTCSSVFLLSAGTASATAVEGGATGCDVGVLGGGGVALGREGAVFVGVTADTLVSVTGGFDAAVVVLVGSNVGVRIAVGVAVGIGVGMSVGVAEVNSARVVFSSLTTAEVD